MQARGAVAPGQVLPRGEQWHSSGPAQVLLPPWGLSQRCSRCFPQEQLLFQLQTFASCPGSLEQRELLFKFLPRCCLRSKIPVLVSNTIVPLVPNLAGSFAAVLTSKVESLPGGGAGSAQD